MGRLSRNNLNLISDQQPRSILTRYTKKTINYLAKGCGEPRLCASQPLSACRRNFRRLRFGDSMRRHKLYANVVDEVNITLRSRLLQIGISSA